MNREEWLVVDTETNGLYHPVYVLEIAAQRMVGWEPVGEPFRVLLNHDVPIDPQAEAIHGYSRAFLRQTGAPPRDAHSLFRAYAGDRPVVAYNLSFDWDRVLLPECARLGIPPAGRKGFCAMALARRVISETPNHRLETVKTHFKLEASRSHRGLNDVRTVVELFQGVFRERLTRPGVQGFDAVAAFSRLTPLTRCRSLLGCGCSPSGSGEAATAPVRSPVRRPAVGALSVPRVKAAIREVLKRCRAAVEEGAGGRAEAALRRRVESTPYPSIYPMCALREAFGRGGWSDVAAVIREALAAYEEPPAAVPESDDRPDGGRASASGGRCPSGC